MVVWQIREDYQNCSVLCCLPLLCPITSTVVRVWCHNTRQHGATLSNCRPTIWYNKTQKEKKTRYDFIIYMYDVLIEKTKFVKVFILSLKTFPFGKWLCEDVWFFRHGQLCLIRMETRCWSSHWWNCSRRPTTFSLANLGTCMCVFCH